MTIPTICRYDGTGKRAVRLSPPQVKEGRRMGIIWTIIIGFIAGVIAKFIMPGDNEPKGFILTTILGIIGAFLATYLGQAIGWYRAGEGAGLIGAIVGAIILLLVWGIVTKKRA
jgi:uncharacterized membrane protein YeaQ/YmgE (transglycosylase-associated protein family)